MRIPDLFTFPQLRRMEHRFTTNNPHPQRGGLSESRIIGFRVVQPNLQSLSLCFSRGRPPVFAVNVGKIEHHCTD